MAICLSYCYFIYDLSFGNNNDNKGLLNSLCTVGVLLYFIDIFQCLRLKYKLLFTTNHMIKNANDIKKL